MDEVGADGQIIQRYHPDDDGKEVINFFTFGCNLDFINSFHSLSPKLNEVHTAEKCDLIVVFCHSDTEKAFQQLLNAAVAKPTLLAVLHNTSPQDCISEQGSIIRDSHDYRLTVDWLISLEDEGRMVECQRNNEAKDNVRHWLTDKILKKSETPCQSICTSVEPTDPRCKYFTIMAGQAVKYHEHIKRKLCEQRPELEEVWALDECDFILFVSAVSQPEHDIKTALHILNGLPASKYAVLMVLHNKHAGSRIPDSIPDSSRFITREKTLTVDCLFQEDKGFLQCDHNQKTLCRVAQWLIPEESSPTASKDREEGSRHSYCLLPTVPTRPKKLKYFVHITGQTLGSHKDFVRNLYEQKADLQEVSTVEDCDVILAFCPVASHAEIAVEASLQKINTISALKPAVLVVLHHTFDQEVFVPDSKTYLTRKHTLAVDCLFHEDKGLLRCWKNSEALSRVFKWIESQVKAQQHHGVDLQMQIFEYFNKARVHCSALLKGSVIDPISLPGGQEKLDKRHQHESLRSQRSFALHYPPQVKVNFCTQNLSNTLGFHKDFVKKLCQQRPGLQEVSTVEKCDIILAFCTVVSRAGTDVENALQELNKSGSKPAVLVVLHHTFNPEFIVPDSSRCVTREKTLAVDCLFYTNTGLLSCSKNDEAFQKVSEWIGAQDVKQSEDGRKRLNN